jgi:hypothetical protein
MQRLRAVLLALVAAFAAAGCDSNEPTTPTLPTPVSVTDTFTGPLTPNGAVSHTYTASSSGIVTLTVKSLTPDNTVTLGVGLGFWFNDSCSLYLTRDAAVEGGVLTGTLSGITSPITLCARVYDAQGTLVAPTNYTIEVVHP